MDDQQEVDRDAGQSVGPESGELATGVSAHRQVERPEEWLALEQPEPMPMEPRAQQPEKLAWQPPELVLQGVSRQQAEPQVWVAQPEQQAQVDGPLADARRPEEQRASALPEPRAREPQAWAAPELVDARQPVERQGQARVQASLVAGVEPSQRCRPGSNWSESFFRSHQTRARGQ